MKHFQEIIFDLQADTFEASALAIFQAQAKANQIYQKYLHLLGIRPENIREIQEIPFLPISFFKHHLVQTGAFCPEVVFESSRTTGQQASQHAVRSLTHYLRACTQAFERIYGPLSQYHLLALLPSYLERQNASLVAMTNHFIRLTGSEYSGFYLNDFEKLRNQLQFLQKRDERKILLLGVTFALLDFAAHSPMPLGEAIVMETGGMKGRGPEMIRAEVHQILKGAFQLNAIHSEYGMTELMSQAYAQGGDVFEAPPWMRVYIRDLRDPFAYVETGRSGGVNIIDLANLDSCAFIATEDIGVGIGPQKFRVLGRADHSEVRGCNLMVL